MNTTASRRRFLHLMGLGAAGPLVTGVGDALVGRALGAPPSRRIGIFFSHGETMPDLQPHGIIPDGLPSMDVGPQLVADVRAWPSLLAQLAPWSSKTVIVDGFSPRMNKRSANHGYQFASFCSRGDYANRFESPLDITLDQAVANVVGKDTPVGSLLFGLQGLVMNDSFAKVFAAGPDKPLPHYGKPSLFLAQIVGKKASASVPGGGRNDALVDAKLFDLLREDLGRMGRGLAGEERALLDDYLTGLEAYQRKVDGIRSVLSSGSCASFPAPLEADPQARMKSMFAMATLALQCGVTNVIGVTVGNGGAHDDLRVFDRTYGGHAPKEIYHPWMNNFYQFTMGMLADMLRAIGPLINATTVLTLASNGISSAGHHGDGERVPGFVLDGTGTLRTGARYYRCARTQGGWGRHIGDLLTTVGKAFNLPGDKFLGIGNGAIPELLA